MWDVARKWGIFFLMAAIVASMIPGEQTKRSSGGDDGGRLHVGDLHRRYHRILSSYAAADFSSSLSYDFYGDSCPQAERIVRSAIADAFSADPTVAPALLRLVFHDCFIQVKRNETRICLLFMIWFYFLLRGSTARCSFSFECYCFILSYFFGGCSGRVGDVRCLNLSQYGLLLVSVKGYLLQMLSAL